MLGLIVSAASVFLLAPMQVVATGTAAAAA
eukprot:COSAG02_NODE_39642_length_414_cov_1.409524_1_plen_29_part_01